MIVDRRPGRGTLTLVGDDGRRLPLDARRAGTLRLAYACSVHKMQGSQAPAVVIALRAATTPMLTRNLALHRGHAQPDGLRRGRRARRAAARARPRVDASRRNTRLVELVRRGQASEDS